MKTKANPFLRPSLLTAVVFGLSAVTGRADVLLTDNFDTAQDGANFSAEPGLSNDQGGILKPLSSAISHTGPRPWTVRRGFNNGSYVSEMAVIGNGAPYGDDAGFNTLSSLNQNFAGDQSLTVGVDNGSSTFAGVIQNTENNPILSAISPRRARALSH